MVIIDSPPLLPVTDGAVAAGRADGALLVTRAGKTSTSQVTAAVRALRAVDARLLGSVFNMVSVAGSDPYHYYEYTDESGRHRAGTEPSTGPAAPAPDQHEPAPPSAPGRLGAPDDELPAGPEPATKVSAAR
jgi:non-specific protein-tyrosine kinase